LFERGEIRDVKLRFISQDRKVIPVELRATRVNDRVGVMHASDLRRQVELERQLMETEARYRYLIEEAVDTLDSGIIISDKRQQVVWANKTIGEFYWGYASGVVAVKVAGWGEFVLAEYTQPFDRPDVSYFFPLMADVERRLGFRPRFGALDAAFDAFYVYEYFHQAGGFAAVPFSKRGGHLKTFDENGLPHCAAGLPMPLKYTFICRTGLFEHERGRYHCPLLYPQSTGQPCPIKHKRWEKGGCTTTLATSIGARIRYQLNRQSEEYQRVYKQRTATERINAQAKAIGIERPRLRNAQGIANQNTLIYALINLRAIRRIRQRRADQ
jgi:hypothetical protein